MIATAAMSAKAKATPGGSERIGPLQSPSLAGKSCPT